MVALSRNLPRKLALEMLLLGEYLPAERVAKMGLVNRVVSAEHLEAATLALAQEIADNAPLAVQASKRMMRTGLSEEFDDHVHHVYLQLLPLFQSEDLQEGMRAFLEKRKPNWCADED